MRRALMIACLSMASTAGVAVVTAAPAAASTSPTVVELPAVPAADGVPFLMTATVQPNGTGNVAVTGTVTFDSNSSPISGCVNIPVTPVGSGSLDATAQCDITYGATGTISITAAYSGDSNWSSSTSSPASEDVLEPATVTASASPTTATVGQSVQLSATVAGSFGTPTGSVEFEGAGSTSLCTATLAGGAGHCDYAFPVGGAQAVTADYLGNSTYADSTGSASFGHATVDVGQPATTTTASAHEVPLSANGVPPGLTAYAMDFTATVAVSGTPGPGLDGSVTFTINGEPIGGCTAQAISGPSPQSITCADADPEQFGGPVVATFSNDPNYAGSSSAPVSPTFTPDTTSVSSVTSAPPSPIVGQSLVLSAQVSAYLAPAQGPTGVVTFTSGPAILCTAIVNGSFAATCQTSGLPGGTSPVVASYRDPGGGYAPSSSPPSFVTISPTLYPVVGMAAMPGGGGYWIVRSDGAVSAFGDAVDYGSMVGQSLNKPIVGMAATPDGQGYWLVASDGGIFSFGDAQFYGSTGSIQLDQPIVGMTAAPNGKGYYFVASDGGVFAFGTAPFLGSMGGKPLNQPVVGMALDPATGGYWLVASDGGIFSFDTPFLGSTGSIHLNKPIVGMEAAPDGSGYRFVASDGGVFSYGQPFDGSTGSLTLAQPVVGMAPDQATDGYWLVARDGGLFSFDAPFLGAATD